MPATRPVLVGALAVNVRELTFGEVRDWMVSSEAGAAIDPLHALAFDDCSLDDLARMCDRSAAELEEFTPSELESLVRTCKELNPHFFRLRAALSGVAQMMLREISAGRSSTPLANSSSEDMPC